MTKLLVLSGYSNPGSERKSEIIDLSPEDSVCPSYADYPGGRSQTTVTNYGLFSGHLPTYPYVDILYTKSGTS